MTQSLPHVTPAAPGATGPAAWAEVGRCVARAFRAVLEEDFSDAKCAKEANPWSPAISLVSTDVGEASLDSSSDSDEEREDVPPFVGLNGSTRDLGSETPKQHGVGDIWRPVGECLAAVFAAALEEPDDADEW